MRAIAFAIVFVQPISLVLFKFPLKIEDHAVRIILLCKGSDIIVCQQTPT